MSSATHVHFPNEVDFQNASSAINSFAEVVTSSLHKRTTLIAHKPQIHLAITSDRVVTETSNLDHICKKTLGIYFDSNSALLPPIFNQNQCRYVLT